MPYNPSTSSTVKLMNSRVKIRFYAMFKEIVGEKEIIQDIDPEATLGDLLNMLAKKYGGDFEETVDEKTGQVDVNTLVMLNGQSVRDTNIRLKNNDLVVVTVPVGGG